MLDEALPVPRLYLYSADDDLCDAAEVQKLIMHKKSQCVLTDLSNCRKRLYHGASEHQRLSDGTVDSGM